MDRKGDLGSSLRSSYEALESAWPDSLFHQTPGMLAERELCKIFFLGASTLLPMWVLLDFGVGDVGSLPLDLLELWDVEGDLPGILRERTVLVSSKEEKAGTTIIEDLSIGRARLGSIFFIAASQASLAASRHCAKFPAISAKSKENKIVNIINV